MIIFRGIDSIKLPLICKWRCFIGKKSLFANLLMGLKMIVKLNNFSLYADKSEDNLLFSANKVEFRTGKMNLIMGPSGTGKTTLLNTLYGMKNHYLGHIQTDESEYDSSKISLSYVTADLCVIPELRAIDYLHIVSSDEDRINHLLSLFHIENLKEKRLSKCSRGEQTRVEICAALLKRSDVYLFDEPTANIDSETKELVYDVLKKFSLHHLVIIATHDDYLLKQNCNAWEIKNKKLIRITEEKTENEEKSLSDKEKNNRSRFPYFPFLIRCGFHHKVWLTIGIFFSIVAFAFSFLSSSFYLIDRNKIFSTAIESLPCEYNQVRRIQNGEEPSKDGFVVTTKANIANSNIDRINVACLEDFDSEIQKKCNSLFSQYQRKDDNTIHPILLTKEHLNYFEEHVHSLSLGEIVPITLESCCLGVDHALYHDSFVLAGVLDCMTDIDDVSHQYYDLSDSFPAIIKRDDYLSCLSHTGYRTSLFNTAIVDLYDSYYDFCFRNHISCPEVKTDDLDLLNLYPYSYLKKDDVILSDLSMGSLADDFILLPSVEKENASLNRLYEMFHYGKRTDSFLKEYEDDGVYRFPIKEENDLEAKSFVVAGQFKMKDESVSMKDCIIVSDSFYQKLIDKISIGWKDGISFKSIFADKDYLKRHTDDIISDTELLLSSSWKKCLNAYDDGERFRSFITVVSLLLACLSLVIVTIFGINEKAFLEHDFFVLGLLGKSKAFCFRLFSFILTFLALFSLFVSYAFSQAMTSYIFSLVCKENGFNGSFAVSNRIVPYLASLIMMLIILLFSLLFSFIFKKKNTNKIKG